MFTRRFESLSKGDADAAGGKGASLGEMTRAGLAVPPGFVILSGAFEKFIAENGLAAVVAAALRGVDARDTGGVDEASATIRAAVSAGDVPGDIASEIEAGFERLKTRHVAVRSSATAEDSPTDAWAGLLDSYLNVTRRDLLTSVRGCWASLFTPRAIFYRVEKGLARQEVSVAVVVQKMVQPEVSGVAFSVHPVTEDRNQMIIEAGFGLCEALVSGQITPDSYVVEKSPRRIRDKHVSPQERGLYRAGRGGCAWKRIPPRAAGRQKLSDGQIMRLAELVAGIERHFGFPCDVEWAFDGETFHVVQSRPVTTLKSA